LFDRTLGDLHYWEMTRYPVFCDLAIERGLWGRGDGEPAEARQAPARAGWGARFGFAFEQLRRLPRGRLPDAGAPLLMVGHPRRKRRDDGQWWDLYLDPVADQCRSLGLASVFVEPPHRGRFHYAPAHTPDLVYLDRHIAWARARPGRRLEVKRDEAVELAGLDAALRSELGGAASIADTARRVLQRFRDDHCMWSRILERVGPRAVFFTAGAGQEGLVAAARERGVRSIELQHGTPVAGKLNYDYDTGAKPRRFFADHFAVFGDYWKRRNRWPVAPERVFELGCPFFQQASRALAGTPKRREVVFLSQATVGRSLARFAAELAETLDERWRLVFKLHPEEIGEWRSRYPQLVDTRIEVVDDREAELHPLLARAEFQVGVYSTALYEGIGLGCKTVLVAAHGVEYMRDVVNQGMALVVSEASEFAAVCDELKGDAGFGVALFGSDWESKLEGFLADELGFELGWAQVGGSR
ncbi:MAG: hypothetical protein ACR2P8_01330, partial [Myxococcota bacterium]